MFSGKSLPIAATNAVFVKILDETGTSATASTSWATETVTVSSEGSYKFVFVAVFKFIKFLFELYPKVYKFKAKGLGILPGSEVKGDI